MGRGGRRKGAGRPKGTGKFGEATKAVRLPISMIDRIMGFIERKGMTYPLYSKKSHAAHPGPSNDIPAERFDMVAHLVSNPGSTFFVRVAGDAMTGIGVYDGDIAVVDNAVEPKNGDVVVVIIGGEFAIRRYMVKNKKVELKAENSKVAAIKVADGAELKIWGVVKNVVHSV